MTSAAAAGTTVTVVVLRRIGHVVGFLYVLPLLITYLHLRGQLRRRYPPDRPNNNNNLLVIRPSSSSTFMYTNHGLLGLYGKSFYSSSDRYEQLVVASGGPAAAVGDLVAAIEYLDVRTSTKKRRRRRQQRYRPAIVQKTPVSAADRDGGVLPWCLQLYDGGNINNHTADVYCGEKLLGSYYRNVNNDDLSLSPNKNQQPAIITVSSYYPSANSNNKDVTSNYLRFSRDGAEDDSSFWKMVTMYIPATSLLISLNVGLAFRYWNYRVPPHDVAKMYELMVGSSNYYEIWRSFSGSLAHFEVWHLGMNMMSLSALGQELEGLFSSIGFLFYNISLIPIVTTIWIGLQFVTDKYYAATTTNNHDPQHHRPTVGYSGVLFAWMVVASLEQSQTCPIIFVPSLCFPTYQFGFFKWSWGPIVQLFVMQVLLPRVSLSGHLAGILAGFLLHWGVLPLRYTQPAIAIPLLYLIYLSAIRKLPFGGGFGAATTTVSSNRLMQCHIATAVASMAMFGPTNSLSVSFVILSLYWYLCCQTKNNETVVVFARGYVLVAVLVVVTDAMTCASWLVFASWSISTLAVVFVRAVTVFAAIFTAAVTLLPSSDNGIFELVFGFTALQPFRELKDNSWLPLQRLQVAGNADLPSSWGPFRGAGRRLGEGGNDGGSGGDENRREEEKDHVQVSRLL